MSRFCTLSRSLVVASLIAAGMFVVALRAVARDPFGADDEPAQPAANQQARPATGEQARPATSPAQVREALASPTRMQFTEMPLIDAINYLKDFHYIEIQLDHAALEAIGVGADTPITRNFRFEIPLAAALRLLLDEYQLDYVVRDEVLMITTRDAADKRHELRVYDVARVVGGDATAEELAGMLTMLNLAQVPTHLTAAYVQPGGGMGGMGGGMGGGMMMPAAAPASPRPSQARIVPYRNLLVIRATQREHEQFAELFDQLRHELGAGH